MSKYSELLKDPRWQKKRLQIMSRDNFTCQVCNDQNSTLNVHHMVYNGDPWDAKDEHLITLCENCHEKESNIDSFKINEILKVISNSGVLKTDIMELIIATIDYIERIKEDGDRDKLLRFIKAIKGFNRNG